VLLFLKKQVGKGCLSEHLVELIPSTWIARYRGGMPYGGPKAQEKNIEPFVSP